MGTLRQDDIPSMNIEKNSIPLLVFVAFILLAMTGCRRGCNDSEGCYHEFIVSSVDLIVEPSFGPLSIINSEAGDVIVMVGKCAGGDFPGVLVKVRFTENVPVSVDRVLRYLWINWDIAPSHVVWRKVFSSEINDNVEYSSDISCFDGLA